MSVRQLLVRVGLPVVLVAVLAALIYPMVSAQDAPDWVNQGDNWNAAKGDMQAFGERFETSQAMFDALKQAAGGGATAPTWPQMAEPAFDWSGIYTRSKGGLHFDPDLAPESGPVTAKLTPAGALVVKTKADHLAKTGGEVDPISDCRPPGTPRNAPTRLAPTPPYQPRRKISASKRGEAELTCRRTVSPGARLTDPA